MKEISNSQNIRTRLKDSQASPLKAYKDLTVGSSSSTVYLLLYEFLAFFLGPLPGGIGFLLRKKFYPLLLGKSGKGLIIGRNVIFRHPSNIILGNNVTIDDNCLIDARGGTVILGENVMLNRNCMVQAKTGSIHLKNRTSIGSNSVIVSMDGVTLEEAVLVAGGCYISAGAYHFDDLDKPVMDQGVYTEGPIVIGLNTWIGTRVTILDGTSIGPNAIIGAGAIVNKDIPDSAIAYGVPCRVAKLRE